MSKKKPVEEKPQAASSPPPKEPPVYRYPLATVAQIAVLLLKENGGDSRRAAKAAIALLDACEGEMIGRIDDPREKAEAELLALYDERDRAKPKAWTFAGCAAYVTGQAEAIRAQPLFRQLLKHYIRRDKAKEALGMKWSEENERENKLLAAYRATPETSDKEGQQYWEACRPRVVTMSDFWKDEFVRWHAQEKSRKAKESASRGGGRPKKERS